MMNFVVKSFIQDHMTKVVAMIMYLLLLTLTQARTQKLYESAVAVQEVAFVPIPEEFIYQFYASQDEFLWFYSLIDEDEGTLASINSFDPKEEPPVMSQDLIATGRWRMEAIEASDGACGVFSNLDDRSEYRLVLIRSEDLDEPIIQDISALISAYGPTQESKWAVAQDCSGFRLDNFIFKVDLAAANPISQPIINENSGWVAIDRNFNYVLLQDGTILRYDHENKAYQKFSTLHDQSTNSTIHSYGDRFVYLGVQSDSVRVMVIQRRNEEPVVVYDIIHYSKSTPSVRLSEKLGKLFIFKTTNAQDQLTYNNNQLISIDYETNKPTEAKIDSYLITLSQKDHYLFLDEEYLYTHSVPTSPQVSTERLYALKNLRPVSLLFKNEYEPEQAQTWVKTLLEDLDDPQGVNIFKEYSVEEAVVIKKITVSLESTVAAVSQLSSEDPEE